MKLIRALIIFSLLSLQSRGGELIFKNKYYCFLYDLTRNTFQVSSPGLDEIVSSFSMLQSVKDNKAGDTISLRSDQIKFRVSKSETQTDVTWNDSNAYCVTRIIFSLDPYSEEIKVNTYASYTTTRCDTRRRAVR